MQSSQRIIDNHALNYAIEKANKLHLPLIVYFGITDRYPEANLRHYTFMLKGLQEVKRGLEDKGIYFIIRHNSPEKGAIDLAAKAALLIVDRGYLRLQRQWRSQVATNIRCPCVQVESDVIVPVELASQKEEFSAATFRPKINPLIKKFLKPCSVLPNTENTSNLEIDTISIKDISKVIKSLKIEKSVPPSDIFSGGLIEGMGELNYFIDKNLSNYPKEKNDPNKNVISQLSPYLHFGQISPLTIALEIKRQGKLGVNDFLEELIVRRELSINFVFYNKDYDSINSIPDWCKKTLSDHNDDKRDYLYTLKEFENAKTHDPYWNAAQNQMIMTGKMHGYMRMYWCKKIIEWTINNEEAYKIALYLNNKYELDGRDPNGYAGIAWCFGKHDRPWPERPVFGKIRYMNANGLKRKFDVEPYAKKYNL